jgi:formate/nitrite transporter
MAGQLLLSAGGGILGAVLFPTGLIAVVLTSGELFTGDALVFVTSLLGGKVTWKQMARNWTVAWIGNFCGALAWAVLIAYLSDALEDKGVRDLAVHLAQKKAFQPWLHIFLKGIGANAMVCLGIWQATCAEEVAGKILAIWFPTTGFVVMGLDHCIANQFFIPIGMMLMAGTDAYDDEKTITVYRLIFQALLPATLGNLVGGGFVIGAVYWYAFDSMETQNRFRERIQRAWAHNPRYYRGTYRGRIPGISGAVSRTSPAISVHGIDDMETAPPKVEVEE